MPSFLLSGLDPRPFAPLFSLDEAQLAAIGARRVVADTSPGFPCRVSLEDAAVGEELLLLPFQHQAAASPYRASGPIYVRRCASGRVLAPGEVPDYVTLRQISVRAYDADDMMIAASVAAGPQVAAELERLLADRSVAYLLLHHAARGCFFCRVDRT